MIWCEKTRASTVPLFETIAICSFGLSARKERAASVASRRYFWIADSWPYAKKSRPAPRFLSSSLMAQGAEEGPSCEPCGADFLAELRRRGGEAVGAGFGYHHATPGYLQLTVIDASGRSARASIRVLD